MILPAVLEKIIAQVCSTCNARETIKTNTNYTRQVRLIVILACVLIENVSRTRIVKQLHIC